MIVTQPMIALYDAFTHGRMPRSEFEAKLAALAGSVEAARAAEAAIAARGGAPQVAPDDQRLSCTRVAVPGGPAGLSGLLCRPLGNGPLPGVLVIHENRGLNPHIEDVTRRMALAGFLALGLDFLSPSGGTPADEDAARDRIAALDAGDTVASGLAALAFLRAHGTGKAGAVGFCWGGGIVGSLAVADPALDAGVVFYGRPPAEADVPRIAAPLQLHYAGLDDRINAMVPPFAEALAAAAKTFERFDYPGANHAFLNDTSAARHDPEASVLAWGRTLAFLRARLA
jgi:carboxymethylenebutenolidase